NASLLHPAIDAAIALRKDPAFALDEIESVEVRVLPFAASVTGIRHPKPGSEARFSAAPCVAVALHTGHLRLDSFSTTAVDDPEVNGLRGVITVGGEDGVGKRGARMAVTMRNGPRLEHVVHPNPAPRENRLSDDELDAKLRSIAVP